MPDAKPILKPNTNKGTTVGVLYWLTLMLAFAFLGYPPFISITLGALGGIAGGLISAWWTAEEDDDAPKQRLEETLPETEDDDVLTKPSQMRRQQYGTHRRRRRRDQTQAERRYGWLFRRNRTRK